MIRVNQLTFVLGAVSALSLAALAGGCQNDRGTSTSRTSYSSDSDNGRVISRTQSQDVTPGGTAVQTRTQIRETPSGERVRETQMRTREVVSPDTSNTNGGSGTTTGTGAGSSTTGNR
jgi:hypothetical protein